MPTKPQFDPRKMMELAVEVMKGSGDEPREDGKASPRVGVALISCQTGGMLSGHFVRIAAKLKTSPKWTP